MEPEIGQATPDKEKKFNPVALGYLEGLKDDKTIDERLSPERRKEIAKIAATTRWRKR